MTFFAVISLFGDCCIPLVLNVWGRNTGDGDRRPFHKLNADICIRLIHLYFPIISQDNAHGGSPLSPISRNPRWVVTCLRMTSVGRYRTVTTVCAQGFFSVSRKICHIVNIEDGTLSDYQPTLKQLNKQCVAIATNNSITSPRAKKRRGNIV